MRLGLIHINMGPMSDPDALAQGARAAEQAGFDSVWAGEHLAAAARQVARPAELGGLEISVTPRGRMTAERAAEFAAIGVHRLVLLAPPDPDGAARTIEAGTAAVAGLR
jgi:hypothetical protein